MYRLSLIRWIIDMYRYLSILFPSLHSIALLRQPTYCPDVAPCDFWLFPKLKKPLKGQRFYDKTTVEKNATSVLKAIPKRE